MKVNLRKISIITSFITAFLRTFIDLRCFFNLLKTIYRRLRRHCPSIQIIYIPMFYLWLFFIFIIIFHIFVISFHLSMNSMHICPLIPFSTINNISISVSRSNFTLVFFEATCHVNPGAEKNLTGSSSYVLRHIFQNVIHTWAKNSVSLWKYKSYYSSTFFTLTFLQNLLAYLQPVSVISSNLQVKFFLKIFLWQKHLNCIKPSSKFVCSRQHLLQFVHLVLWIPSKRLLTTFDNKLAVFLVLSIKGIL